MIWCGPFPNVIQQCAWHRNLRVRWHGKGNACENNDIDGRCGDCRKIGGAKVSRVFSRLFSDQGWMRGLDFEVGEYRG